MAESVDWTPGSFWNDGNVLIRSKNGRCEKMQAMQNVRPIDVLKQTTRINNVSANRLADW